MWEDRETKPRDYLLPCKCGKGRFKKLGYNTYNTCLRNKAIPKIYLEKDDTLKDIYPDEEIYNVRNFAEGVITGNDYNRGDFEFEYQDGVVEIRGSGNSWDGRYTNFLAGEDYTESYEIGSSPEEVANKILDNFDKALGVKEGETKYD
jgi:hypothetical protein